ncbi:RidA family protein [Thermodesulfobacteriota bacterium]
MEEKRAFQTERAADFGGPYSQAVIHNGLIYLSGQGPVDPETNKVILGTIEEETRLALENIRIILDEAGSSLTNVLKVNVYLLQMKEYGRFNEIYKKYFQTDLPARSCIQAGKLPFGIRVEIDVIAYISVK